MPVSDLSSQYIRDIPWLIVHACGRVGAQPIESWNTTAPRRCDHTHMLTNWLTAEACESTWLVNCSVLKMWTRPYTHMQVDAGPELAADLLAYQAIIVNANSHYYNDAWLCKIVNSGLLWQTCPMSTPEGSLTPTCGSRPPCTRCSIVHPLTPTGYQQIWATIIITIAVANKVHTHLFPV